MSEAVKSSLRTVAKGTALVFFGIAINQALWFITRLLIVRNLSTENLGIFSLAFAIISILALFASMGLKDASTRYISIFAGQNRKADAASIHRSSLKIGTLTGGGACAAVVFFSAVLSRHIFYKPELTIPLIIMSLSIPFFVMALIQASVLRGYGDIRPNVYYIDIGQPFLFLILISFIFFYGLSFISVMYAYVFSMAAVYGLIVYYAFRKTGIGPFTTKGSNNHVRELLKFSIPVLSIDVLFLLFRWTDTLILGRYGSAEEVGIYSVSVSLAVLLSLPLAALWYVYLPIAGDLYAKNRSSDLARTYKILTKWIFAITVPVFFVLFFFPEMTISFLFGERFGQSNLPLRILSLGYLFTAFVGANSMLLLVFGLSKAVMKISAVCAFLNILLNYILIKHLGLGIQGAAIATMVSLIAVSLGYSLALYRHSGMHPISPAYMKLILGAAISGIVIYAISRNFPLYSWMIPFYFLLYMTVCIASLIFTRSLDAEDIFLFEEVMKRAGVDPRILNKIIGIIYKRDMEKIDVS